jgi:hypothetical protein
MERGAVSSAMVVLALVGIVGVLAAVALTVRQPTGLVMQNEAIYTTERAVTVGIACKNFQNLVYFLGYTGNYAVYCCTEDMTSANECKYPHNVLIPRTY